MGAGKIGGLLARRLVSAGHELGVIERDPDRCENLQAELGSITILGDGTEEDVMTRSGVNRADAFVATAGSDEDNLVACQMARHRFRVGRTMAIVNLPEHARLFGLLGIEAAIDLPDLAVRSFQEHLSPDGAVHLAPIPGNQRRTLVTVKVSRNSPMAGRTLAEIALPQGSLISMIVARDGTAVVPNDDTRVQVDDEILAVTRSQQQEELRDLFVEQFGEVV